MKTQSLIWVGFLYVGGAKPSGNVAIPLLCWNIDAISHLTCLPFSAAMEEVPHLQFANSFGMYYG